MAVVAKRRWRTFLILRRVLMCAIGVIAVMALLSVHVQEVIKLPVDASYKLPTQQEIGYQRLSREKKWLLEFAPPHLFKSPLTAHKLDGASGSLNSDKLWKPPPNRDYVPCTEPSSSYTDPKESRGYLLVHTNGGLNQMRAGTQCCGIST